MLIKRIITGTVLFAASFFLIMWGNIPFAFEIAVIIFMSIKEFYNLALHRYLNDLSPSTNFAIFSGIALTVSAVIGGPQYGETYLYRTLVVLIILNLIIFMFRKNYHKSPYGDIGVTIFGILYIAVTMNFLLLTRMIPGNLIIFDHIIQKGPYLVIVSMTAVTSCDVGAFFIGKLFGKIRVWPSISPRKTLAGTIAGILSPVIVCFYMCKPLNLPFYMLIVFGLSVGIFAQLGDLFESWLKRDVGVKDSGNILAGHGGFMDRFDSYYFTAPVSYFIFKVLFKL